MTNLRSRPLEGYITDNAGNIIRNADVVIKNEAPTGSYTVTTAQSDDDGYFQSEPVKNGVYDVYESGIRVFRIYHSSNPTIIQCYKPNDSNIPYASMLPFSSFIGDTPSEDINNYRMYLQIEPETIDVATFGNTFPLWMTSILTDHEFENIANIHDGFVLGTSYLTSSRFDIEFYRNETSYSRARWAGVPGITFTEDSKLVLPLDYASVITNRWSYRTDDPDGTKTLDGSDKIFINGLTGNAILDNCEEGDIVAVENDAGVFYGIVYHTTSDQIKLREWKASPAGSISATAFDAGIQEPQSFKVYNAFLSNFENYGNSIGDYFTVQENVYAQDLANELYDYEGF